jgi:NTE family protein
MSTEGGIGGARRVGLVLGGGGVAGVAWHTGILCGLEDAGVDLGGVDLFVGTSAGATVAAQIGGGHALASLYARQVDAATLASELTPEISVAELWERMAPIYATAVDDADRRRRLGALAMDADTVPEAVRRRVIETRLAGIDWDGDRFRVVAVAAATGARQVFDGASGVDVVDAVTASCAVPGVWPPVTIDGERYIDGGVWSLANVDLAAGCSRVLVVAPLVDRSVHEEIAALGTDVLVELVSPDEMSVAAFGPDVLDPVSRGPSALAGRAQAAAVADRVAALMGG